MAQLKLYFLGQFHVTLGDLPLTAFRSNKTRALLAYLVLEAQRPIARQQLASLFWEGYQPATARASLRSALTNLRNLLKPLDLLRASYRTVQFDSNSSQVWSDVKQLELMPLNGGDAINGLGNGLGPEVLYRGEFLEGFEEIDSSTFQIWLMARRNLYRSKLKQLTGGKVIVARPPAIALAPTVASLRVDESKSRLESTVEPERYLRVLPSSEEKGLHNLPRRLTPLIGRDIELRRVQALLLADDRPLITILGEGGVGKSSLAIECASQVRAHFPDGVWFVDLSKLEEEQSPPSPAQLLTQPERTRSTHELHNALATILGEEIGLSFHNTDNPLERLIARLRNAKALLILDSYESLPDKSDFVLRLMKATETLKVLVTSRRPLNLMAEYRYYLEALATPIAKTELDEQELLRFASIELFVQRAQAIQPNFAWDKVNAPLVAQICRLVGGVPLGIELAAVQLRHHDCATILANLERDFSSVATWMLDVPARHRNMQTVLAASWQLLNVQEREVLAACTIFRGGFDTTAAEAVAGATKSILTTLIEHSLLRVNGDRFEMHDLVRQFASRHLKTQQSYEEALRAAHTTHYITFLQNHAPEMNISGAAVALIQVELENIRAAWEWAITTANLTFLTQGWQGLFEFYRVVGFAQEGVIAAGHAAAVFQEQPPPDNAGEAAQQQKILAMLLVEEAHFHWKIGKLAEAETLARQALEIGRELNSPAIQARVYYELSDLSVRKGQAQEGIGYAERGRIHARAAGNIEVEVMCLVTLALNSTVGGEHHAAAEYGLTALARLGQMQNLRLRGMVLTTVALNVAVLGEVYAASNYYTQALVIARQLSDKHNLCRTLAFSSVGHVGLGQYQQARQEAEEAIFLAREMDDRYIECLGLTFLGLASLRAMELPAALQACEQALQVALNNQLHHLHLQVLVILGQVMAALNQYIVAEQTWRKALERAQELKMPMWDGLGRVGLAELYLAKNQLAAAHREIKITLANLPKFDHEMTIERSIFFFSCYRVLMANNDPEAEKIFDLAYQAMQGQLDKIHDPVIAQAYQENVLANRQIRAIYQAQSKRV